MTNSHDQQNSEECRAVGPVLARVGERWSMLIVMMLSQGARRFNDLKRSAGGISQRMLTLTLRRLERDGLVERTTLPTVPPGVEYALTELGQSLASPVAMLGVWARRNYAAIARSRSQFDAAAGGTTDEGAESVGAASGAERAAMPVASSGGAPN